MLTIDGAGSLKLSPVFKDGFTNENNLYEFQRLEFKNANSSIIGLKVSMARAEKIRFIKLAPLTKIN
jgi:hypothetical protein